MGCPLSVAWPPDIASEVETAMEEAAQKGYATTINDSPFFLTRKGYLEETYFDWSLNPVWDANGHIEGFINVAYETTRQILTDRRTKTLIAMRALPDLSSFWENTLHGFESNAFDIPWAAVYSCRAHPSDTQLGDDLSLVADLSLMTSTVTTYNTRQEDPDTRFLPLVKQALVTTNEIAVFHTVDGSVSADTIKGLSWRGFGEASNTLVVMKFAPDDKLFALLLALNPRKALDDDYESFLQLPRNQLSTSLISADLLQQANARQVTLTQRVTEGETRFKTLTELSPVGMYCISPEGEVLYGNDTCMMLVV